MAAPRPESGPPPGDVAGSRGESGASSWESALTSVRHSLRFVSPLREEFVCPVCGGVVLDPQQNSCGHIYCFLCLRGLREGPSASSPVCPVDGAAITPAGVFQDNCCKREISGLEVYCVNFPACTSVVTLRHLQEHLADACPQRMVEPRPHCQPPQRLTLDQDRVQSSCLEVDCPVSCSQTAPRHKLIELRESCPEQVDCPYEKFGCSVQDTRGRVKLHEDAALHRHMLLVLRSNTHLEQQVEVLREEEALMQQEVQTDGLLLAGLQKTIRPLLQQNQDQELTVSAAQRTLGRQEDVLSAVRLDVKQVSRGLGAGLEGLEELRKSLDAAIQEVSAAEALRRHLGTLEEDLKQHSGLLHLHAARLSANRRHLRELGAASFGGRLVWKIDDFGSRREAEVRGQPPCLSSVPFHAGTCGYNLAARVYLNGDGEGRGTHVSLYVVLLPGDFDALLPWPFRQTVTLSLLDQSGAANHRSLSFRPDPTSKSFGRPAAGSAGNVAVGFPCFVPLGELEPRHSAEYVKDDALFVKVKVDMAGLDP
ncbi:TNF receptor-associated factor 5 isoform X1 [Pungitius pungitius]|uniref:TNF receptor-associated factor 5 isoform X1 n=1 Tax=Pungitius pungitius TaxID=134920 RepID=UPI002E14A7CF